MAHEIKLKNVETAYSQGEDKHFLDVEVEVLKDGEFSHTLKFGFPIDSSKEYILDELAKVAARLDSDEENGKRSEELNKSLASAADVTTSLMDGAETK